VPCATTLRAVPSTTSDAVFGHNRSERSEWRSVSANPHAPRQALTRLLPFRRRGGIFSTHARGGLPDVSAGARQAARASADKPASRPGSGSAWAQRRLLGHFRLTLAAEPRLSRRNEPGLDVMVQTEPDRGTHASGVSRAAVEDHFVVHLVVVRHTQTAPEGPHGSDGMLAPSLKHRLDRSPNGPHG
jgi:hypothetical protein